MLPMTRLLFCSLALSFAIGLTNCGSFESLNKKPKFTLSFHPQAGDAESPRSVFHYQIPGHPEALTFKRVPEITQENVSAFHSFPASNGNGYGVALRLDLRGTNALELMTRTRMGEVVLALVDGKPVDYLTIDRPVADGMLTIWEGVPEPMLKLMAEKWPPINQLKSMSNAQEMLPTTRAEKRRAQAAAEAQTKAAEKARKEEAAKPKTPAEPQTPQAPQKEGLPAAPTTKQIPLEGAPPTQPQSLLKQ